MKSAILLGFLILMPITIASADTYTAVIITSDQNIIANITAQANGSTVVYINGVNILDELNSLHNEIKSAKSKASRAYNKAKSAYKYADTNRKLIDNLHALTENNTMMLFILKDEVVAFEHDYFDFKNSTNNSLKSINSNITLMSLDIDRLKELETRNEKIMKLNTICITLLLILCAVLFVQIAKIKKSEKD